MADTNDIKCNLIQGVSIAQHNLRYACNNSSDDVVFINRKTAEHIMMVLDNVCKFLLISEREK